jgi:hypothetical protein
MEAARMEWEDTLCSRCAHRFVLDKRGFGGSDSMCCDRNVPPGAGHLEGVSILYLGKVRKGQVKKINWQMVEAKDCRSFVEGRERGYFFDSMDHSRIDFP